jgi:peptidase E
VSTLHLIGGGPGAIGQTRRHIRAALAELGKKKPLVAYVGAASNDNAGFRTMLSGLFVGTGARIEAARLASARANPAKAIQLLEDCDAVFLSGGDVELGMKVLEQRGAAEPLRRLARAGKPMLGISAGSIMLGLAWVRFPDENDDESAEPFACLGVAPLHMDAHSEDDGWSELKALVRQLGRRGLAPAFGYGVPSKGCLRVDGSTTPTALGAPVARFRYRDGEAIEEPPLAV